MFFLSEKFGYFKKMYYLCIVFQKNAFLRLKCTVFSSFFPKISA